MVHERSTLTELVKGPSSQSLDEISRRITVVTGREILEAAIQSAESYATSSQTKSPNEITSPRTQSTSDVHTDPADPMIDRGAENILVPTIPLSVVER